MRIKAVSGALAGATIVLAIALGLAPYWTAAALIARAAGATGWIGSVSRWAANPVSQSIQQVPIRASEVRARVFRPDGAPARAALLVSGVHPDGIDEPRLMSLAAELAATGVVVVTPEIDDLLHYRITARVTDTIENVAQWMTTRPDLFGPRRIGLIGVSFSGGLSIVAAGRSSVRDRIAYVLSFGGHGDLPRVLRYLCTGEGSPLPPHDYALAIILHQAADLAVPHDQVAALREGVEAFLAASALHRTDPAKAQQLFDELRALPARMPEPAATLMRYVNERDVAALGRSLVPYLPQLGQDAALSPERSSAPAAPIYLLHGSDDNVIPAFETTHLAEHLKDKTRVHQLTGGFLTHVDVAGCPGIRDTWNMIAFWKRMLDEYDADER